MSKIIYGNATYHLLGEEANRFWENLFPYRARRAEMFLQWFPVPKDEAWSIINTQAPEEIMSLLEYWEKPVNWP